jgi:ketosteroid isomerase-like protein
MTQPVPRPVVEAFYQALATCDMATLSHYLDDDVVWTISGPVDILPFCGTRHGKAAVLDLIERKVPAVFRVFSFVHDAMLVDGDRAAVFGKLTATKRDIGHAISYRIAQFLRFRDEKVIEYISIIDSFDAVEQVLGHPLDLREGHRAGQGDLIAV